MMRGECAGANVEMSTAATCIKNPAELDNPGNVVKVVVNAAGRALLIFPRRTIPYLREGKRARLACGRKRPAFDNPD